MRAVRAAEPIPLSQAKSDGDLVREIRAGSDAAAEVLFRRFLQRTVNLAIRLMPDEDPEDLAQDSLVEALDRLDDLVAPEAFGAWLRQIVVSKVTRRLKRRRLLRRVGFAKQEALLPEFAIDPAAPADVRIELRQVYAAVASLPVEERVALLLRRIEGLSLDEVAKALHVSLATAKRGLASAEERLRGVE